MRGDSAADTDNAASGTSPGTGTRRRQFLKATAAVGGVVGVAGLGSTVLGQESGTTIELGGEVQGWQGRSPSSIGGETNPTLELTAGEEVTVTWENLDGAPHNIRVLDSGGSALHETEIISEQGVTQTTSFTATAEMAEYDCVVHPTTMVGDVNVSEGSTQTATQTATETETETETPTETTTETATAEPTTTQQSDNGKAKQGNGKAKQGNGTAVQAGNDTQPPSNGEAGSQTPLIVTHDTVLSAQTVGRNQAPCSLSSRFLHGQRVIFRIGVINPDTGNEMDDSALEGVSVRIKNGGGQTVDGYYGPHPPENPTDMYWVAAWTVPEEFPAGPVNYEIVVDADRAAKSYRFEVPPAHLMVLEGTYSPDEGN